jgi:hypothetical protein
VFFLFKSSYFLPLFLFFLLFRHWPTLKFLPLSEWFEYDVKCLFLSLYLFDLFFEYRQILADLSPLSAALIEFEWGQSPEEGLLFIESADIIMQIYFVLIVIIVGIKFHLFLSLVKCVRLLWLTSPFDLSNFSC